jgi:hypothetical protein
MGGFLKAYFFCTDTNVFRFADTIQSQEANILDTCNKFCIEGVVNVASPVNLCALCSDTVAEEEDSLYAEVSSSWCESIDRSIVACATTFLFFFTV